MKLLMIPLFVLIMMGVISQLVYQQPINLANTYSGSINPQDGQFAEGGQNKTITTSGETQVLSTNMVTGMILIITGVVALGVVVGIRVVGSGISEYSVQLIHKATAYYSIWGIFSGLAYGAFSGMPLFGTFIWFILTFVYTFGFFQTLQLGGSTT